VFDLVVVLRRLRSGRRIIRQLTAVDGIMPDGGYRLTDVFRAEAVAGSDEIRFVADAEWTPSPRLLARLELEGERWS
jgi:hypothetical protein